MNSFEINSEIKTKLKTDNVRPRALFVLDNAVFDNIYSADVIKKIESLVDIIDPPQTAESLKQNNSILNGVDVIFSGWGMPVMDNGFLAAASDLKAVFYSAGSVKYFITDYVWDRNIVVCSAYAANAIPVAEFALSQILSCLKRQFYYATKVKKERAYPCRRLVPGGYKTKIGIISLGRVSRHLIKLLKSFDVSVLLYDTYIDNNVASELGVNLASLEEIFSTCDVISLHSALNENTKNMIRASHFEMMKHGSAFVNTSRGAVVCEKEMIEVLAKRDDITAMLDVTDPEPPLPDSPLYQMPNIFLTPHLAGSLCNECTRMAYYMVDECRRFINGQPLQYQITQEQMAYLA